MGSREDLAHLGKWRPSVGLNVKLLVASAWAALHLVRQVRRSDWINSVVQAPVGGDRDDPGVLVICLRHGYGAAGDCQVYADPRLQGLRPGRRLRGDRRREAGSEG